MRTTVGRFAENSDNINLLIHFFGLKTVKINEHLRFENKLCTCQMLNWQVRVGEILKEIHESIGEINQIANSVYDCAWG